jgi:RNA polymerase sigma-70 factor (sigma-E family)
MTVSRVSTSVVRESSVARVEARVGAERPSLAELYQRSAPAAVRLAYLMTGDRSVAEDITQDAFVRVSGRLAHLRERGAFDAYLRRAVVNLAKNHHRRRSVERAFLDRTRPASAIESPGHEHGLVERAATMAALGRLPQRQRAALVLRFYEDLSEDAIAQILRCRNGTVRSLVTRGVQALRADLARYPDA